MRRSVIETIMGGVVLLVAGVFLVFAYNATDFSTEGGYTLEGRFNSIDGLTLGSDVRIGGVKVGTVTNQYIDPELYQAVVVMSVRDHIRIPEDSLATISSEGLLGGTYVKIDPGTSETLLADGNEIGRTKDVVALEELLGRVIFLVTGEEAE